MISRCVNFGYVLILLANGVCLGESTVLSNGTMLLRIDEDGSVGQVQWPRIGAYGQVREDGGARWGIDNGDSVNWIGGEGWVETARENSHTEFALQVAFTQKHDDLNAIVTYTLDETGNRFASSVRVTGVTGGTLVWAANFDPTALLLPGSQNEAWTRPSIAGRSGESNAVVHARPSVFGRAEISRAQGQYLRTSDDWRDFGEGTWIACEGGQGILESGVNLTGAPSDMLVDFAYGQVYSRLIYESDNAADGIHAEVVCTLGTSYEELETRMGNAHIVGERSPSPEGRRFREQRDELGQLTRRLLDDIVALQDAETGAVIRRTPGDEWATPVDIVDAAQCLYVLGFSNREDAAKALGRFLVSQIITTTDDVRPLGAVYGQVYVTSDPAQAHYEVELLPAASILWAVDEFARQHNPFDRPAYVASIIDEMELAADFLEAWSRPLIDRSAQFDRLETDERIRYLKDIASAQLGLSAAANLFRVQKRPVPQSWEVALNRARRIMTLHGHPIRAPWDVEAMSRVDRTGNPGSDSVDQLRLTVRDLTNQGERRYALLSGSYAESRQSPRSKTQTEMLAQLADDVLGSPESIGFSANTGELARLLAILFQSYQSVP